MTKLQAMLAANEAYLASAVDHTGEPYEAKLPRKKIAVFTCMDTRLTEVLEAALGLSRGDAKIIRTVGNYIASDFDTVIRSLMVAVYELGVEEIFVVGHYECGMAKTTAESLTREMKEHGVSEEAIEAVRGELSAWADAFEDPVENVRVSVEKLRKNPYLPDSLKIHGLMIHPRTGKLDVIVNGDEE